MDPRSSPRPAVELEKRSPCRQAGCLSSWEGCVESNQEAVTSHSVNPFERREKRAAHAANADGVGSSKRPERMLFDKW